MSAEAQTRLIQGHPNPLLPPRLEQALRRMRIDKFTGTVELNMQDGLIHGWHEDKVTRLAAHEIK